MGGIALGVPGVAAKPHNDDGWKKTTGRAVNQILEEPEVRTLLDELGNPPLQRGRGQKATVDVGASQITRIAVPSHVGTLLSSKSDNGINETFFAFGTPTKKNGRVPPGFLKRLPPEYRDLPAAGEGVLRVGADGEPALFSADGESAAAVPEQETLVDNEEVKIVKSASQAETTLVREFKRGPKAGTIQATGSLSDAEVRRVESSVNSASAQSVSTSDVSTADIEIPTNFNDVVERYEIFGKKLDDCGIEDIEEIKGYAHTYAGARVELTEFGDVASKSVLSGVIAYLLTDGLAALLGSSILAAASTPLSIVAAAIAAGLIAINTVGSAYTVGVHDVDQDIFFDTIPTVPGAVAGEYRVPLSETQYAGSVPLHFDYDYIKQLPVA
jgi:hypothetical protein